MAKLYDAVVRIETEIQRRGLDATKTKGQISMLAGFFLVIVRPDDPDDPERIEALQSAARQVLGSDLGI